MRTIFTMMPARFLRRACLLALTAAAGVLTASPAANALLIVGHDEWGQERLAKFVVDIKLAGYLKDAGRDKFIPNLVHFMTEGSAAQFMFANEDELRMDLISLYVDEHMKGLSEFQRLTHDERGAIFVQDYFEATGYLKWADNQIQNVAPRDFDRDAGAKADLKKIITLLNDPANEFPLYMNKRPKGKNLWLFRTMSKQSASYIYYNFEKLLKQAKIVAQMIVDGNPAAANILKDKTLFSAPDIEYALNGHFGDLFQALTYNTKVNGGDNVLVGFKIKNGAELVLYSPLVMVMAGSHVDVSGYAIAKAMLSKFGRVNEGSGSDGIVKGYLSLKHELRGDFSFGLSQDPASIVLFCLLVSDYQIYGKLDY